MPVLRASQRSEWSAIWERPAGERRRAGGATECPAASAEVGDSDREGRRDTLELFDRRRCQVGAPLDQVEMRRIDPGRARKVVERHAELHPRRREGWQDELAFGQG